MENYLPENLITLRNILDKTQSEMADIFGIKRSAFQKYEKGTSVPSIYFGVSVEKAIGISTIELCTQEIKDNQETRNKVTNHILKQLHQ